MADSTTQPTRKRIKKVYHAALVAAFTRLNRVGDVAEATGISRRTIQRWRAEPENWAEVVEAQRGFLSDTLSKFRIALPELAAGMVDMARNAEEPAAVRLRASMGCFETFAALSQRTELEQRMAAIEEALAARSATNGNRSTT